jgi:hypothetical protein
MRMRYAILIVALAATAGQATLTADGPAARSPKEALQPFNDLIGSWKGTGEPPRAPGKQPEFWLETVNWEWQFKGTDAWLKVGFDKSKNFSDGELRYLADKDLYQLTLRPAAKGQEPLTFTGRLKSRDLTVERKDDKTGEIQRLLIKMLHTDRFLYSYEVRRSGKAVFSKLYRVGCTRLGIQFAGGDGRPECVVSGGLGTIPVMHMGQTYYVCCSGCRREFNEDPAKYIKEYNEKKAKKK